jgi:tellurium resistance protein TerD
MAINLTKGQRVDVTLKNICVGLGWDPATGGMDFDLDASAFMIGSNGKCLSEDFFVYYNNPKSKDGAVESSGDDRTGGSSD